MQNFLSKTGLLSLTLFTAPLFAGTVSVPAIGTAEADPDLYVYSFQITASCFDSDAAVETKVADLEEKLSQVLTPYLAEGVASENQYYTTSSDLPEQTTDVTTTYVRNTGEQKVTCSAGKWYYSSSSIFKLLDVSKRKELQKALTKLTSSSNQLNAELALDKQVWSVSVSSVQPGLKPETKDALFVKAYEDASKNAKKKLKTILATEPSAYPATAYTLVKATENPEEAYSGRNYAFESAAFDTGRAASPGVQKQKLSVSYRFEFDVSSFAEQK